MTHACAACRYSFSSYKCWGPHAAALYGSHAAFEALGERGKGPNHFWIPAQEHVYKARSTVTSRLQTPEARKMQDFGREGWEECRFAVITVSNNFQGFNHAKSAS